MPYYVPTKDNQIVTSQSKSSYEFNCASDCVSYLFWGKKLVLAQGAWLKAFLESREIELLSKNEFVRFSECKVSK